MNKDAKDTFFHLEEDFNNFFELSINLQLISTIEGKIIEINSASKSILGYEKEELINSNFTDLLHPDDVDVTITEMSKLSKGENVYFFENRYKHKNGTYVNLAWSATTNNKDNQLIFASAQNTTQSKLLELEKKEKEKILYQQSKMAAMGEMLGNIAHQWRQPLSIISTASTGAKLQKEMGCLSDSQLESSLIAINESAQYLSATIDDFKNFFDPNNNKINEFNIEDTLSKTFKLINSQFITKDIEIIKNIESYSLASIENELIQVLINILNNARDILTTKERKLIFINTYEKHNILYIEILDNGDGIDDDIVDRIFEPYFTTKHQSQGTGIGLYMSEEIIKNHLNGTLRVCNENYIYEGIEYKGAKFTIELPL